MNEVSVRILVVTALLTILTGLASAQANPIRLAQAKSTQDVQSVDMSAVPQLDGATIRRLQNALRAKGFDPGPANGVAGEKTKAAVQKFQDRFGISGNGAINNQTLFALGIVGSAPAEAEKAKKEPAETEKAKKKKEVSHSEPKSKSKSRRSSDTSQHKTVERSSPARRAVWCALYSNGGRNCGFSSAQQCQGAISGVGGSCYPE
jgi:peptidoglycan hydrolase-like protein with peptidoglycan-binding domain